jgi:LacI family transcriptional regulator
MRRPTIKDIGTLAGVNPSTVSRALSDHKDISVELKQKIKAIAESVNYKPNSAAVNLRNKKSKLIGLILPQMSMHFIPSVIDGVSNAVHEAGYKLLVLSSDESIDKETENIKICCDSNVEGILISVSNQTLDLEHLKEANDLEVPVVLYDKTVNQSRYDELMVNDATIAKQSIEYLIKKGCKNILGIFGNKNLSITNRRLEGFKNALVNTKIKSEVIFAQNTKEAAELSFNTLSKNLKIDGVFMMSDELMVGLNACNFQLQQKKIAFNYKPIAISDGVLPYFMNPPVSFIKHSGYNLGTLAAKRLLQHINENVLDKKFKQNILETELIEL